MAGRPTKYNEDVVQRITQALRAGNTRRASCAYAGISQDTLANWLKSNSHFADAIEKAEGDAEVRNVAIQLSRLTRQSGRCGWNTSNTSAIRTPSLTASQIDAVG